MCKTQEFNSYKTLTRINRFIGTKRTFSYLWNGVCSAIMSSLITFLRFSYKRLEYLIKLGFSAFSLRNF